MLLAILSFCLVQVLYIIILSYCPDALDVNVSKCSFISHASLSP
jgi:hypothetical protein